MTTWTKEALIDLAKSFLLMEDGHRLLLQDENRILIYTGWTNEAKQYVSYTKEAK